MEYSTAFLEEMTKWVKWDTPPTQEMLAEYEKAVTENPDNADKHFELARCSLGLSEMEKARCHLEETLRLSPQHARHQTIRLWLQLYDKGREHNAMLDEIRKLQQQVAEHPQDAKAHAKLAAMYREHNMLPAARGSYKNAVRTRSRQYDFSVTPIIITD